MSLLRGVASALAIEAAIAVVVLASCQAAANAAPAVPPTKIAVIERIYPDLAARATRADMPWRRLRMMAATRWWRQHPEGYREYRMRRLAADPTPANNRRLAELFFGYEFPCAAQIIEGETGGTWRHDVAYGFRYGAGWIYSGHAYGLGQARPGTKMLAYGADAASNPLTQLRWFRAYAQARYGSVCAAAAHWTPRRSW